MAFSFHRHILPSIDIGALNRCGVQDLRVETILQHQLRDLMFDSYRRWEFDLSSKPVPKHRKPLLRSTREEKTACWTTRV
jgi:hypothetical protein